MAVVAPCITVETPEEFKAAVDKIMPFAERVHIDVSDGQFAPRRLLDPSQMSWPANWTVDIHAMVKRPRDYLRQLMMLRPYTVVLHAEAEEEILSLLKYIKDNGSRPGIALLKSTVVDKIAPLIEASDYVMIFSGDLGRYGGKASMLQLEKIRRIKAINPNVEIAWDGGVSVENAFMLAHGGVDVLNSGGAISNAADPREVYNRLVAEANRRSQIDLM